MEGNPRAYRAQSGGIMGFRRNRVWEQGVLAWLIVATVAAFTCQAVFTWFTDEAWAWISTIMGSFVGLVVAAAMLRAYRIQTARKTVSWRPWFLIGIATVVSAFTDFAYNVESIRMGYSVSSPHFTDIAYLGAYAIEGMGILLLVGLVSARRKLRLAMDSLVLTALFSVLAWFLFLEPIWRASEGTWMARAITTGYISLDFLLLFGAMGLLVVANRARLPLKSFVWYCVGAFLVAAVDYAWAVRELQDDYVVGAFLDVGWSVANGAKAMAILISMRAASGSITKRAPEVVELAAWKTSAYGLGPHFASVATAITFCSIDMVAHGAVSPGRLVPVLILSGCVMIRQSVVILELQRELRTFYNSVQHAVEERTTELRERHRFASDVTGSLDPVEVMRVAGQRALATLRTDAVRISILPAHASEVSVQSVLVTKEPGDSGVPVRVQGIGAGIAAMEVRPFGPNLEDAAMLMRAPINWAGETIGVVHALKRSGGFDDHDREVAEAMCLDLAAALSNAFQHQRVIAANERDYVTGLLNHRALNDRLLTEYAKCAEAGSAISMMVIDVAGFKRVNDVYGHLAGDDVLRLVATELQAQFGDGPVIARTGGDEFAVILPGWGLEQARTSACALHESLREQGYRPNPDEELIPVALNVGLAANSHGCVSAFDMFARADGQLLAAKRNQRETEVYEPEPEAAQITGGAGAFNILEQLVTAIDNLDSYTRQHSEDVTEYALWIGAELACSSETMRTIRLAALLHDVGKICVPAPILRKPGRLTDGEYEIMKQHPIVGAMIVRALPGGADIVDGVEHHHERYDGQGYPAGLAGDEIPFLARLLAVADAVSAMTTNRPYRKGLGWDFAIEAVREGAGSQFDPRMAEAFLRAAEVHRQARRAA